MKTEEISLQRTEQDENHRIKQKLANICMSKRFCGICLESPDQLWDIDAEFDIAVGHQKLKKMLKDIIDYILKDNNGHHSLASTHLCSQCTEKSIQFYLFVYNVKQLSEIITKCVNELESKASDVYSRLNNVPDFENSNVVIVLEQDSQMCQYTDIDKMTEIIAKETPKIYQPTYIKNDTIIRDNKIEEKNIVANNSLEPIVYKNDECNTVKAKMINSDDDNFLLVEDISVEYKDFQPAQIEIELKNVEDMKISEEVCNDSQDVAVTYLEETDKLVDAKKIENGISVSRKRKMTKPSTTYKCLRCWEILPWYRNHKEHEKVCRKRNFGLGKPLLKCKVCKKVCSTTRALNTHYKTHSKTRCRVCQFIVPEEDLPEHMSINHESYVHMCKLCSFFSFNADRLKSHMDRKHSGPHCALCFKKVKQNDLKTHKCRFNCLECTENVCIHYKYLVSYKEQVLNYVTKIKCPDCDYICPRREALLGHVNREHLDHHPFTCAHCSQQFYSRTTLRYHLNQFHKEKHVCQFCDQEFSSKLTLDNHQKLCQCIERDFKCDHCTSTFGALEELANHVKLRHNDESFDCNLCERKFLTNVKLQEHLFKVHNGLQMKRKRSILDCPICDKKFENKRQLLQHTDVHGTDVRFPCKDCNEDFDSIKKLHAHMRTHYDDVIQCIDCKKVLTATFFPHHMVYCKPGREEKDVCTCETCGKTYPNESQLRIHRRVHMEKVPCPICKKTTKPAYLKKHIRNMHSKPKKDKMPKPKTKYFKCDWCEHAVSRYGELEAHVNRFHLKVKPYQCHYCNKAFFGKERLRDHLITHTTSKTCYCKVCNQKFQNNICLKLHMRRHTGSTPYACEICGERFRTSSIMNTHKVKKHSERTVACPLCSSMFFLTREMRSHFKKVHWKQKDKKFDPRDVKELSPAFYHLFEDGRLPKVEGEDLCISSKSNEKFVLSV